MSLIYDYLKIAGETGSEMFSDVEIPSSLKRRYTNRLNTQSLILLLLGSCLIGVLFIFLVNRVLTTGRDVQVAIVSEPVNKTQVDQAEPVTSRPEADAMPAPEPAAPFRLVQPEPVPSPEAESLPAPEPPAATDWVDPQEIYIAPERQLPKIVDTRGNRQAVEIQVIEQQVQPKKPVSPEIKKPIVVDTTINRQIVNIPAIKQDVLPKKPVQPLVLKRTKRKIVFPQNVPVSPAPEKAAEDVTAESSGAPGENATLGAEPSPSSGEAPAVFEKSRKFYQAGLQAQHKGDGRIAELYYNKALEEMPKHMDAMINLSALYVQQGRYAEAEKILAEIFAIEPANSKALVNMGVVSLYQGNESQAAEQFEAALAANPREENALVNLAYLAEKKRDYPATEMYYRQLLQISPANLEVLLAYAHLLEEQRRYREAIALYNDSLVLDPVKKDRQLYRDISDRIKMLAGAVKNSQP